MLELHRGNIEEQQQKEKKNDSVCKTTHTPLLLSSPFSL